MIEFLLHLVERVRVGFSLL